MRHPVFVFLSLVAAGLGLAAMSGCASAGATTAKKDAIVRVWTEYREATSFARFGGYPSPETDPGGGMILRSQPGERTGFYFTVRVEDPVAVPDGRLVLAVVAPDAAEPRTYEFPFTANGRRSVQLLAGLTGTDWPYGKTMPLAWRIQLLDSAGRVMAERQSYLWAQS